MSTVLIWKPCDSVVVRSNALPPALLRRQSSSFFVSFKLSPTRSLFPVRRVPCRVSSGAGEWCGFTQRKRLVDVLRVFGSGLGVSFSGETERVIYVACCVCGGLPVVVVVVDC